MKLAKLSRQDWQRLTVVLVIVGAVVVAAVCAFYVWPDLPAHRALTPEKYEERIGLLKYFISLSTSAIVATWFVVCRAEPKHHVFRISITTLTWAWTFLGVSVLSAIMQIYLTYKDFFYWPLIVADGYMCGLHKLQHSFSLYLLHLCYSLFDYFFFFGWVLIILAVVGVGSRKDYAKSEK